MSENVLWIWAIIATVAAVVFLINWQADNCRLAWLRDDRDSCEDCRLRASAAFEKKLAEAVAEQKASAASYQNAAAFIDHLREEIHKYQLEGERAGEGLDESSI